MSGGNQRQIFLEQVGFNRDVTVNDITLTSKDKKSKSKKGSDRLIYDYDVKINLIS